MKHGILRETLPDFDGLTYRNLPKGSRSTMFFKDGTKAISHLYLMDVFPIKHDLESEVRYIERIKGVYQQVILNGQKEKDLQISFDSYLHDDGGEYPLVWVSADLAKACGVGFGPTYNDVLTEDIKRMKRYFGPHHFRKTVEKAEP